MGFLTTQDEQAVQKEFEKLTGPVTLSVFASELGSENNSQVVALIKEVGALTVKVLNPYIERDETAAYGISVTPAVAVEGSKDYGIRFLGVPAGYEFSNL